MNETLARHSVQDAKRRSYMALGVPLARIPLHVLPSVAASDVERPENDLRLVSAARPPAETCELPETSESSRHIAYRFGRTVRSLASARRVAFAFCCVRGGAAIGTFGAVCDCAAMRRIALWPVCHGRPPAVPLGLAGF
jgi:hypothetical protein